MKKIATLLLFAASACLAQEAAPYYFVGQTCSYGSGYNKVGELLMLTPVQMDAVARARCAIIPASAFQALGFTSDELSAWGINPTGASGTYLTKLAAARSQWLLLYNSVLAGTPLGLSISGPTTVNCAVGVACSQTFAGSGGTGPYTFSVASGSLPEGLELSSAGVLSGSVASAQSATVTLQVEDDEEDTATLVVTVNVGGAGGTVGGLPFTSGTAVPGGCTVPSAFIKTDASAGQNWYLCLGGTYVLQGGAGSGAPTDAAYWTSAANGGLSAEVNLGALANNAIVAVGVSAGVATPRAATAGDIPAHASAHAPGASDPISGLLPVSSGTTVPGGCTSPAAFIKTDASSGQSWHLCIGGSFVKQGSSEGGGLTDDNFSTLVTPSGTVDGSNKVFTLANAPSPAGSLLLYRNGLLMSPGGVDFTLSGATITFVDESTPQTGDLLRATYRK